MGVATQPATVPPNQVGATPPPVAIRPFRAASYEKIEPAFDATQLIGASQVPQGPFDIPSGGWLRSVILQVSATTAGNAATVAFFEDAPYNVLDAVTLLDVKGAPIVGPISGFDLFLINLFGGIEFDADPTRDPFFLATTGAGATGGTFAFIIRIPVEAVPRDAIGAIANGDAAATLKVRYSVNTSAAIYTTAPTTLPSVRVQGYSETWVVPEALSPNGNPQAQTPPGNGTLSMWSKQNPALVNGANVVPQTRRGNWIRNMILVTRNATPVRSAAILTDPFRLIFEGRELMNCTFVQLRSYMQERFGYAAAQMPTGIYVVDFMHEFSGHPGHELRDLWLGTSPASRIEFNFTTSAVGSLTMLVNDVAPHGPGIVS